MKNSKLKTIQKSKIIKFYSDLFSGKAHLGEKMGGEYKYPISSHVELIERLIRVKKSIPSSERNRYILHFLEDLKNAGYYIIGD